MYEPSFEIEEVGLIRVITLRLPEMMDSQEFDRLNEEMLATIAQTPMGQWVLDLANLNYMGSSSLGLMVNLRQQIKTISGQLILCNLSPQLLRILRTCCLERLFVITKTRDEAMRKIKA